MISFNASGTLKINRLIISLFGDKLERKVIQMEENKMEDEETTSESGFKNWLQENLRIIISVIIVIAIAGGIYSYSKRSQAPVIQEEVKESGVSEEQKAQEEAAISVEEQKEEAAPQKKEQKEEAAPQEKQVTSAATSKETENSFVETAVKGNGKTHLARRALADYLEKNPDSSLTPEHKIYIEDYLRKKVGFKGGVKVGTSVEFSKDLIREAVDQSKKLNEKQLKNLHKYAVLVPSLS